jgi:hypothetical protein
LKKFHWFFSDPIKSGFFEGFPVVPRKPFYAMTGRLQLVGVFAFF